MSGDASIRDYENGSCSGNAFFVFQGHPLKPEKAVTTHPVILEALIRLLHENNNICIKSALNLSNVNKLISYIKYCLNNPIYIHI